MRSTKIAAWAITQESLLRWCSKGQQQHTSMDDRTMRRGRKKVLSRVKKERKKKVTNAVGHTPIIETSKFWCFYTAHWMMIFSSMYNQATGGLMMTYYSYYYLTHTYTGAVHLLSSYTRKTEWEFFKFFSRITDDADIMNVPDNKRERAQRDLSMIGRVL